MLLHFQKDFASNMVHNILFIEHRGVVASSGGVPTLTGTSLFLSVWGFLHMNKVWS